MAKYVIEGKLDKETLAGTYAFGDQKGDFTSSAWPKRSSPRSFPLPTSVKNIAQCQAAEAPAEEEA